MRRNLFILCIVYIIIRVNANIDNNNKTSLEISIEKAFDIFIPKLLNMTSQEWLKEKE
jgi:hypothetical protein